MSNDWMPGKRADQLALAKTWIVELPNALGMWQVLPEEIAELDGLVKDVENADERVESQGTSPENKMLAREAYMAMCRFMRILQQRRLFSPPMKASDWERLGMQPREETQTACTEVSESVEFVIRLREIRELLVDFWIAGAADKAKPDGYDGAVVVWDVLDNPPEKPCNLTRHSMAIRTPYTLKFSEEERGKTVYVSLCWQNEWGITGAWSEVQSAVIP